MAVHSGLLIMVAHRQITKGLEQIHNHFAHYALDNEPIPAITTLLTFLLVT